MLKKNFSKTEPVRLTSSNYYRDKNYMDVSAFKPFLKCEASALAQYQGKIKEKVTVSPNPLIFGNYIHSYFQSKEAHEEFLAKEDTQKEIFKYGNPKNGFKKDYSEDGIAGQMIGALERQPLFTGLYGPGDKEVIVTGKIDGYPWKGKIDSLNLNQGYFCDLKTVDNFHKPHWNEDSRYPVNFAVDRGYFYQIAMYQELIYQQFDKWCIPYICAVSKQDPPDVDVFKFASDGARELIGESLDTIEDNQEHVFKVIAGEANPYRCERCAWCRKTKVLTHATDIMDIELY